MADSSGKLTEARLRAAGLAVAWRHAKLRLALAGVLLALGATAQAPAQTGDPPSAVVVMYHRFGEESLPTTNIRLDQFERHLEILTSGAYNVVPLSEVIDAFRSGTPLPDRTVAITIDDAYRSVYREAWPRLRDAGLPFTIFANTDSIGAGPNMMTWDEIRELAAAGVEIGAHGAAHGHMAFMDRGAVEADFARMTARFNAELGFVPTIYAYPYGEYNRELAGMVEAAGYQAAFGQHSGVAYADANLFTLPRFALNERYGEPDRFDLIVNALPLPVIDIVPDDMLIAENLGDSNPPLIGFTVTDAVGPLDKLSCFASTGDEVEIERLGSDHVELRLAGPLPPGRSRLNCTLPVAGSTERWRWLGLPFLVPGGAE
jgi:peptidoglycan/xylan/chitin deacetylase (PgdA/CDA1 family)